VVNRTLARRYAIAISSLASDSNAADAVGEDLAMLTRSIGTDGQIHDFFVAPVIPRPEKERVLQKVFGGKIHPIALHALLLLVRKRREPLLAAIADEYAALARAAKGKQRLTLTSAQALDREEYSKLVARLERLYDTKFEVTEIIDPKLIGGVRLMMGDRRIDASISGRLDALARDLSTQTSL
jgi:F-type H+-transporting ATPase subunit delta